MRKKSKLRDSGILAVAKTRECDRRLLRLVKDFLNESASPERTERFVKELQGVSEAVDAEFHFRDLQNPNKSLE